ncbi:MAG: hypothetical protein RLZZ519_910 [Bacteroidota bacterium]
MVSFTYGQTIQNVNPSTTTAGQSITMIITGNNTNFTTVTGTWLRHQVQSGTIYQGLNYTPNSSTNATVNFNIPPNAPLGNYRLESYGGFPNYNNALNVGVGPGSNYGYISGKVISDANSNCVENVGEDPFSNTIITLTPGPYYLTTGPQGDYGGWIPLGNYTLTVPNLTTSCGNWVCPGTGSQTASIPTSMSQDNGNDFYWHDGLCTDLATGHYSLAFRPGFNTYSYVNFANNGTVAASNVTATYTLDPLVTFVSSNPAPTSVVGNVVSWLIPSAPAGYYQTFTVVTNTPSLTPLNTPLAFVSSIPIVGNDPYPNNNNFSRTYSVVGSYDPNDKRVWDANGNIAEGPVDPSTNLLRYMIRFQNTGTDTAFNIVVRDTLSSYLNAGSLRVTGASHNYQVSLTGQRNVQFTFPNIMLADSFVNEPLSHGYIAYEINLNAGVPVGTTITNRAGNYFDFMPPVPTNTTSTTLCALLSAGYTHTNSGFNFAFTNASTGAATSWQWDFGDGGTSTAQNPTHTYTSSGSFVVCLTIGNGCRTTTFCDTVTACQVPVAAFTSNPSGLQVAFTDQSHPTVTTWTWDFGDGGTSTLQNPSHTYIANGTYNVCLTATNSCTNETVCQTVMVCASLNEAFSETITGATAAFQDLSDASATTWSWDFGDGGTSSLQNPSHNYAANGTFNVCLTVSSGCSTATTCHNLTICRPLNEAFTSTVVSALSVDFQDLSDASATTWAWDFGDGGTSSVQNPNHIYANGGAYNVCLTVSSGCATGTTCDSVALAVGLEDALGMTVQLYPNPSAGLFVLEVNSETVGDLVMMIFDAKGTCVLQKTVQVGRGDLKERIDLSHHSAGLYLIQLEHDGKVQSLRIQKQ